MKIAEGQRLSHYKVLSKIGSGGMGDVYLAEDTQLHRKVAVKFLPEFAQHDHESVRRFEQEAHSASALNHPNILTIHEFAEYEGSKFIVTEFIEGQSLKSLLHLRPLGKDELLDLSIQIASALDSAHRSGIIHRDVKPENIMVRHDGIVKILDFGLAKPRRLPATAASNEDPTRINVNTEPGMLIGTARYMSPEQAKGEEVDARTDVFSLGVVIYEMASRSAPFSGDTPIELMTSLLRDEPRPLPADVPEGLNRIIRKCLEKKAENRYSDIGDLLSDLQALRSNEKAIESQRAPGYLEKTGDPTLVLSPSQAKEEMAREVAGSRTANGIGRSKSLRLVMIIGVIMLIAVPLAYYLTFFEGTTHRVDSLAVLPFAHESGDGDVEYLADGLTESLISSLSKIPDVSVKASSSVFFFKGRQVSPKAVGEKLSVDAVVTGRLIKRGDVVELSLELADTKTEDLLWSDRFDRKITDLPMLQREIAVHVSERLRSTLTGEEQERISKSYTSSAKAYDAYMRGRFFWNQRTDEGFKRAAEFFERAIDLDPGYALAWSGLADTYFLMPEFGVASQKEYLPKARSAARKALELDPDLAEAQTSMAYILHSWEWKFEEAEKGYKRAIELDPNYATAHQWYGELLAQQQRFNEAEKVGLKAVELDPLSFIKHLAYGQTLWLGGKNDEALEVFARAEEIEPDIAVMHKMQCLVYFSKREIEASIRECEKATELGGEAFKFVPGVLSVLLGEREKAERSLAEYDDLTSRQILDVAFIHANLGNREKAIEGLEILVNDRSVFALFLEVLPGFETLHSEPGFRELADRVGLSVTK